MRELKGRTSLALLERFPELRVWLREGKELRPMAFVGAWRSPLLGVTMKLEADGALSLFRPDGRKFLSPVEQEERARHAEQQVQHERAATQREREAAQRERERAERLAAKLRELGIDPATLGE